MSRSAAVTFKGNPMTLAGEAVNAGDQAPDFKLHYFKDGFQTVSLADTAGKPTLISVVPSLDTGVCAIQTKKFNDQVADMGDSINALTVSLDLPFAQGRFCTENGISNMQTVSDYQDRKFGQDWGMMIEELKLLARGVFVLDGNSKVVHAEICGEVTDEPNYEAAISALKSA